MDGTHGEFDAFNPENRMTTDLRRWMNAVSPLTTLGEAAGSPSMMDNHWLSAVETVAK